MAEFTVHPQYLRKLTFKSQQKNGKHAEATC